MKRILRYITNALLIIGLALCFGGVGLADEYIITLSQDPPKCVWTVLIVGVVLMIPAVVRMFLDDYII